MIGDLKPYPSYKDSGVPGLGDVPEHWRILRIKDIARLRSGDNITSLSISEASPYPVYGGNGIRGFTSSYTHDGRFVLIGRQGALCGNINYAKGQFWASEHAVVVYPRQAFDLVWFGELLRIMNLNQYSISAAQPGLAVERIQNLRLPVPPTHEQTHIGRHIGHLDRRIRRCIRAKQKLIALLNEQEQAIIHRAVTRGLDSNVRLKSSGVEWLGDVPEHWETRRVKQVSQIVRGRFTHRPRNDPSLYDGPYPFIQTGEVARATKTITEYKQTLNERGLVVSKLFPAGTLVMTIAANIGDVAVLGFEACFPDSVVGFVPRTNVDRDYLYYVFRSMKLELLLEAPVNTQGNLNVDRIGSRRIAMPSVPEQQQIVRYVERSTAGLTSVMVRAQREISLLREYRTRLIADVVTGKLDEREVAARLPEESDEPELMDDADALTENDEEIEGADPDAVAEGA